MICQEGKFVAKGTGEISLLHIYVCVLNRELLFHFASTANVYNWSLCPILYLWYKTAPMPTLLAPQAKHIVIFVLKCASTSVEDLEVKTFLKLSSHFAGNEVM